MHSFFRRIFYYGQWHIAFAMKGSDEPGLTRSSSFCTISPPLGYSYADPFLLRHKGRAYLFFEVYSQRERGVIAFSEIIGFARYTQPKVVLRAPYHLSYPFVFEWNREIYLLPETQENETIELYRATAFPCEWVLDRVLMRGVKLVDPTLYFTDSKWWLFAGCRTPSAKEVSELYLFVADSPLGPWIGHPRNPVVIGEHCARPAGRLFQLDGKLVRPGQDSSRHYGEAIWLNRVERLTESEYQEVPLLRLGPETLPDARRTHTLDFDEQMQVQDGLRFVSRLSAWRAAGSVRHFIRPLKPNDAQ
jgi:hypothetical protein